MSLSQKIAAAVDAIQDTGTTPRDVSAESGAHRLALRLESAGPVGLAFETLEFTTLDRADWSINDLKGWGERLAARLTYLMEPLTVLEADPIAGEVVLRSQSPTPRHDRHAYYEARLHRGGTLRLGRVAFDETERRRQPASCQMTREVLERLADDLVASVA